jgi:hypothetical protein
MRTAAPILTGVVLIGALGVAHGLGTDRWGSSGQLERAVASLDRVPPAFGDWSSEDLPLDTETLVRGGIKGSVYRRYRNSRTQEAVTVLLVCGRGGPISVHTPEVCYAGAGYRPTANDSQKEVQADGGGQHTFRASRFAQAGGVSPHQLEVYLAWSRDGRAWEAPQNPRMSLARSPALYKLYVVREFLPSARSESSNPCQAFLRRALADLGAALSAE